MGYLKTVLTYDRTSEAEVDKSYLESQGISVYLMNGNTTRNELGAPFYIQLQVGDGDFENARDALRAINPKRFGSPAAVAEIDRAVKRTVLFFVAAAIPAGLIAFWLIPQIHAIAMPSHHGGIVPNLRIVGALVAAIAVGSLSATFASRRSRPPL
jgi:hypothetical protein